MIKGLDEHEKKCVDEEFDINISQRGKGIIGAYEDHDTMTNGTKLETKSVLRNLFDCSALEKCVKFVLNNALIAGCVLSMITKSFLSPHAFTRYVLCIAQGLRAFFQ